MTAGLGKPVLTQGPLAWLGGDVIALALAGLVLVALLRWWQARAFAGPVSPPVKLANEWLWVLALALLAGALVRLTGLDFKGLSHTEAYIPGLDLPPGISEPPPRHEFWPTLVWHFHKEPHPLGYYMAMWAWTQAFGASIISIRLPEALAGIASILVIYRVGQLSYNARTGAAAAALLALHGFHVFWSQMARMYVPGALLGLVAVALLLEMLRSKGVRPGLEAAFVAVCVAGVWTVEFFWPLLGMFILWAVLANHRGGARRMGELLAFTIIVALPGIAPSVMLGGDGYGQPATLEFLRTWFSFGFLFDPGAYREVVLVLPLAFKLAVLGLALLLLMRGLTVPANPRRLPDIAPSSRLPLLCAAALSSLMIAGMAMIAYQRVRSLSGAALLPWLALLLPWLIANLRGWLMRVPGVPWLLHHLSNQTALVPLLALLPTLLLWAVSLVVPVTVPRAFSMFVPYLLLVIAAGVVASFKRRSTGLLLAAGLALMFGYSSYLLRQIPNSPRDYRGLAQGVMAQLQPGDLIFVPYRHWAYTPSFFYLPHERLVASDYTGAVKAHPMARIWVLQLGRVRYTPVPPTPEMAAALARYVRAGSVDRQAAAAVLYLPPPLTLPLPAKP